MLDVFYSSGNNIVQALTAGNDWLNAEYSWAPTA